MIWIQSTIYSTWSCNVDWSCDKVTISRDACTSVPPPQMVQVGLYM